MRGVRKLVLTLAAVALLGVGPISCGEDDSSNGAATTAQPEASRQGGADDDRRRSGRDGGAGSAEGRSRGGKESSGAAEFRVPGGDNSIQEFGGEAAPAERQAAAAVLKRFLAARAGEEWAQACAYIADSVKRQLEKLAEKAKKFSGCAEIIAALSANLPASAKAGLAKAEVGSLRVEGERAFALYHGAEGVDYFMPMADQDGEWKVTALAASAIP